MHKIASLCVRSAFTAAALVLGGCQALNHPAPVDIAQPTEVRVLPRQAPAANTGAIYQAGQYRPLFEDYRARMPLQAVKGMNDILPPESARWEWFEAKVRALMTRYAYANIRTPIVEPTAAG